MKRKEVVVQDPYVFPCVSGELKLPGRPVPPQPADGNFLQGDGDDEKTEGDHRESSSKDFWSMSGGIRFRHHEEPGEVAIGATSM